MSRIPAEQAAQLQDLMRRGFAALASGRVEEAGECCQQALQLQPELVQAHFLVGLVGLESKDRASAFRAFQSVVKLDRDHAAAWAQLARMYMSEGQVNKADAALRETRRIRPTDPIVLDLIGMTLSQMGEYSVAKAFFARANTSRPNHPPYMLNLANNLVYHGDTDTADIIFRDVIRILPDSPQAHWALAGSAKASDGEHIDQMRALAAKHDNNPRARAFYLYAIGKECEDLKRWDEAFEAFSAGAAARRATVEYDEAAEQAMFDYLQESYTREWFDSLPEGNPNPAPIFVLGQPRTGTTLVERIIVAHSQVHSAGELQQFGLALRRLSNYRDPRRFTRELFELARATEPAKVGNMYLQTSSRMAGSAARFVDKLPQNYLMIPLILKALPNARIVHLVRNPMDACFASFKQLFADAYLHSYQQGEMARHHARYRRLMDTWRERFPGRFFDISYEATAADLEPNARALLDYLDLPWEEACLEFHKQDAAVSTASAVQVREPAHTRSIGRWKQYRSGLAEMQQELAKAGIASE
ncbi:sulfotransferase family protein [Seongchinamella sediminis]|uniref:Sulfotransferase family protein n=1 Tax=Seongchinamella sediminis TaxID=2283635 RepID=A0A3L7E2Q6_9GAMM|nr:tetratricopeptide repeat-containing sulfotransferase family protein [Seongchinamella sediminis]RLQ23349.1 sulfotransferase family protein [Seongchinamella sediminis]